MLHQLEPWHFAIAGAGIAGVALTLQAVGNRALGVSTGLEEFCSLTSRSPYFARPELRSHWRLVMFAGLVCGGVLSAVTSGGWQPTWDVGMLDSHFHLDHLRKIAWFLGGGLLTGIGTRMAGGCTSGHGIYGMARLQPGSFVSVLAFMASGVVTANLLWRVLAP
jgi:uncharacterized membrane protein YedE/YeeE